MSNLDISTRKTCEFLTPCLGDAIISFGFRKNFHTHRMIVEPRNKDKIKKISLLFSSLLFSSLLFSLLFSFLFSSLLFTSFLFFLCTLHREDNCEIKWDKKKPTESDIKNQKPNQMNNTTKSSLAPYIYI